MCRWLIALLAAVVVPGAQAAAPKQYQIDMTILSGDPLGSREQGTVKCLGNPRIITLAGRPAEALSGGEQAGPPGSQRLGTAVRCVVEPSSGRRIHVKVTLEYTQILRTREGRKYHSSRAVYTLTFHRDQMIKVRFPRTYQPQTWVEIRVRPVE